MNILKIIILRDNIMNNNLTFKGMKIEWLFYKPRSCKIWIIQMPDFISRLDFKRVFEIVKNLDGKYTKRLKDNPSGFYFRDRNIAIMAASQIYNYFHEDGIYPPLDGFGCGGRI